MTDPGDGVDNDCDGTVDEEVRDGKDNDNDGKIDEDLELVKIHYRRLLIRKCYVAFLAQSLFNRNYKTDFYKIWYI